MEIFSLLVLLGFGSMFAFVGGADSQDQDEADDSTPDPEDPFEEEDTVVVEDGIVIGTDDDDLIDATEFGDEAEGVPLADFESIEIYGNDGADEILVDGPDESSVSGGEGDDTVVISGSGKYTTVHGDSGDDLLIIDDVWGGDIFGGDGNDTILLGDHSWRDGGEIFNAYGGAGDDNMIYTGEPANGGSGDSASRLYGGEGADTFQIAPDTASMNGSIGGLVGFAEQFQYEDGTWSENYLDFDIGSIGDFETGEDKIVIDLADFVDEGYDVGEMDIVPYGGLSEIVINLSHPDSIPLILRIDVTHENVLTFDDIAFAEVQTTLI